MTHLIGSESTLILPHPQKDIKSGLKKEPMESPVLVDGICAGYAKHRGQPEIQQRMSREPGFRGGRPAFRLLPKTDSVRPRCFLPGT
jgi:hypothetical protein